MKNINELNEENKKMISLLSTNAVAINQYIDQEKRTSEQRSQNLKKLTELLGKSQQLSFNILDYERKINKELRENKETRQGSLLYKLGNNVKKVYFKDSSKIHGSDLSKQLDSLAKIFNSSFPYNTVASVESVYYISLSQGKRIEVESIRDATVDLLSTLSSNSLNDKNLKLNTFYDILLKNDNLYVKNLHNKSEIALAQENIHLDNIRKKFKTKESEGEWIKFIDNLTKEKIFEIIKDIYIKNKDVFGSQNIKKIEDFKGGVNNYDQLEQVLKKEDIYIITYTTYFDNGCTLLLGEFNQYYQSNCRLIILNDNNSLYKVLSKNDIENIKNFNITKNSVFIQITPDDLYMHMHSELNLAFEVFKNHTKINIITFGSALNDIHDTQAGSCGYCVAALDAFSQSHKIEIHRTNDFPQNIPRKDWSFPHNLLDNSYKCYLFFKNIKSQYEKIYNKNYGDKEAYEKLSKIVADLDELFIQQNQISELSKNNHQEMQDCISEMNTHDQSINLIGQNEENTVGPGVNQID